MNKQERHAKAETIVGGAKQATGILTGDKSLEHEGARQRARGKFREHVGTVRRKIAKALNRIAGAINR